MKRVGHSILLVTAVLIAGMAQGQYVFDDGETSFLYGTYPSNVLVGINEPETGVMVVDDSSAAMPNLWLGCLPDSPSNSLSMMVDSTLVISSALRIGSISSHNTMMTSDGSLVYTGVGIIGYSDAARYNEATISGDGSLWYSYGNMINGYSGSYNTLEVMREASLVTEGSLIVGYRKTGDNNTVTVSNSMLVAGYDYIVGLAGSGNELNIMDGSEATTLGDAYVGVYSNADNNVIYVSGAGTTWTNYGDLYIGSISYATNDDDVVTAYTNSGNFVSVTNGGSVVVYEEIEIEGDENGFNLDNGGSLTVLTNFNASMTGFNFNAGGSLYVAGELAGMAGSIEDGRTIGIITNGYWSLGGSNLVIGSTSSDNRLLVLNEGEVYAGGLYVGATNTAGNSVELSDGAVLGVSDLVLGGTGNSFVLGSGSWLTVTNGVDVSAASGFDFQGGATLQTMGALTGMEGSLEDQRILLLEGSGAGWDLGTDQLQIGVTSSSNELYVTDGAQLVSGDTVIGSSSTIGSLVYVSDTGSFWSVSGDLSAVGYYNDVIIGDGAGLAVDGLLSVTDDSSLTFGLEATGTAGSYYQGAGAVFAFSDFTNVTVGGAVLDVSGAAEFETGATVTYVGEIGGMTRGTTYTNTLVASSALVVGGVSNAATADLDALDLTGTGSLLDIDLLVDDDDLIALMTRLRLADSAGFADESMMGILCEELDLLAVSNATAETMLELLSGMDSSEHGTQLAQLYDRHAPTYSHTKGMLEGFRQVRARGVEPNPMLPVGAMGPHFYGSQKQGWIKGYGSWAQRDGSGGLSGYDLSAYGAIAGLENNYGDILAGLAGGLVTTDIDQDDGDSSEASTGYGLLYASWGTLSWFGDVNLGYGHSSIKDRTGTDFDSHAKYDANQLAFYVGGGREMVFRDDKLFVTPTAALSGYYYMQDSYTETATTALAKRVDDFAYFGMQSDLGVKVSYTFDKEQKSFVPEMHANWIHEFNADEERVDYTLVGGAGEYSFCMQAPVEDIIELGGALSWWRRNRRGTIFEWSLGLDGRLGDGYSETTASGRMQLRF